MTNTERIASLEARITEENQSCLSTDGIYWAVSAPTADDCTHTLSENLIWETMHSGPRPIFQHQIFRISNGKFGGHVDIRTQCSSITRHNGEGDIHKCLHRNSLCFKVELDVISYTVHPLPDFPYPDDLDIFRKKLYDKLIMIYSHQYNSGRIITCGYFYNYVPPFLAATDGLIPSVAFEKLLHSRTVIPDITTILH